MRSGCVHPNALTFFEFPILLPPQRTYQSLDISRTNGWFQCIIHWVKSLMNSFLLFSQCKHVLIGHKIRLCASKQLNSLNFLFYYSLTYPLRTYQSMYISRMNWWLWCIINCVKSRLNSCLLFSLCKHVFIGGKIGVCASIYFQSLSVSSSTWLSSWLTFFKEPTGQCKSSNILMILMFNQPCKITGEFIPTFLAV